MFRLIIILSILLSSVYVANAGSWSSSGSGANLPAQAIAITNAATVGLTITGATSQSANLVSMRNSTGTVMTFVSSAGGLSITNGGATSAVPLSISGVASQSGNLLSLKNSTGTVLSGVNSSGQFIGDGSQLSGISGGANTTLSNLGTVALNADLLPGVDATISLGSFAKRMNYNFAKQVESSHILLDKDDATGYNFSEISTNANNSDVFIDHSDGLVGNLYSFKFFERIPGMVPVAIQGAALQSGHLLDFENSTGTVLGFFASNGSFNSLVEHSAEVSITGVVSSEDSEWITGNCSLAASVFTCTVTTFSATPKCVASPHGTTSGDATSNPTSNTSVDISTFAGTTGLAADRAFTLICHGAK